MLGIFDSHAHYEDGRFDDDRHELLSGMSDAGVELIMNVASDIATTKKTMELTEKYPFVYGSAGVHPEECGSMTEDDIIWLEQACDNDKIVAVGEIGLDYHWGEPAEDIQIKWFRRQLELAIKVDLPVIIHSRDAAEDTMNILREYKDRLWNGNPDKAPGVLHCFSGSAETAREYVKMGYFIGVGGVVTFKNAKKLISVVEAVSIDNIVIETDCPYMAPEPHRGKRNDSSMLKYVAEKIAEIKGMTAEDVIRITRENALKLYRLV